jgi:hypothetical protein
VLVQLADVNSGKVAGCRGAARAGQRSGASSAGAVAKGRPAPSKEALTIAVSRPQPSNEHLSACAEVCGLGEQSRSSLPSVGHRDSAFVKRGGRRSAAERVGAGRERQATRSGLYQCLSAWKERASGEGTRL